ncbi:diacylglycerol/lipid kinase family protein [Amycolatopsis pigmentata]|uniref:Diacylglycerol/lipid kinase family protein n=1 Tax=Amycolatopsis pigmentata TaxID=450801 RepID=A0ABW5FPT7_9PSEU
MRAALVVHAGAGRGAGARIAGTVATRLRDSVDRLDLVVAPGVAEFREAMSARAGELDALIVLGGDGTAHEAVQFCAGTSTALGLVPVGSGNDLARGLGLSLDPLCALDTVVSALRTGLRRRADLGRADGRWFATVLCAGFDAGVSERARTMTWPGGTHRYDLATLAELRSWRAKSLCVRTETETFELEATMIAAGNTPFYGGGIPICPGALAADGLFDVTLVGRVGRAELLRMLPHLRGGAHVGRPGVRTFRAREIALSGDFLAAADGEPLGSLPVVARCVPGALTLLG